jgi:glycosyltransferase involved in cell wall biosynthesis
MKILYAVHNFPPQPSYGSELYACNLARALKGRHDIHVFYRVNRPARPEYEAERGEYNGLKVCTINNTFQDVKSFRDTYQNEQIAKAFGRYIDDVKPDLVHFQHVTCLSTTCIREAADRGLPVFYTLHDFWLLCPRGQLLRRDLSICDGPDPKLCVFCNAYQLGVPPEIAGARYARIPKKLSGGGWLDQIKKRIARNSFRGEAAAARLAEERLEHVMEMCRRVSMFLAPSKFIKRTMERLGLPGKIEFLDYGYDLARFAGFERKVSAKIRFGYVGSLIPSKGVHVLIEAFRRVDAADAELRIYGAGYNFEGYENYEKELRALAEPDQRIIFAGPFDNANVKEVFSEFDVLVVPSIWYENAPLTIHEAVITGTPVVASNIGGMAEYVRDGVNGLTFRVGSARDLARKIGMLVNDRALLTQLRPDPRSIRSIGLHRLRPRKTLQHGNSNKVAKPRIDPRGMGYVHTEDPYLKEGNNEEYYYHSRHHQHRRARHVAIRGSGKATAGETHDSRGSGWRGSHR